MRGDETFAAPADGSAHRHATKGRPSDESSVASGSPVPPRRTFAPGIHALRSLRAAIAFALRAALTGEAGSRSTGDPSLKSIEGVRVNASGKSLLPGQPV
jgi:hypothetical protein